MRTLAENVDIDFTAQISKSSTKRTSQTNLLQTPKVQNYVYTRSAVGGGEGVGGGVGGGGTGGCGEANTNLNSAQTQQYDYNHAEPSSECEPRSARIGIFSARQSGPRQSAELPVDEAGSQVYKDLGMDSEIQPHTQDQIAGHSHQIICQAA